MYIVESKGSVYNKFMFKTLIFSLVKYYVTQGSFKHQAVNSKELSEPMKPFATAANGRFIYVRQIIVYI